MFIGKRLNGRYLIEKRIGGGGMSNVYLAHDMILEREVAVKMLRLDFHSSEEFIKRFQREAHSISALSHPNIVSIYDVGEEDDVKYIVMEYMKGPTLKEYIQQKGALTVEEAVPIMKQLAAALYHAHHFDIIHRDIKPQNILLGTAGDVKLTDFGIATMTDATSFTETNALLGSVHYLSPEQARGSGASKKSDIYSLGTVFFEMLAGRPPFSGESPVAIALKHLQSETPSVRRWYPEIPQCVENIILRAMAKDPNNRYGSADKMREDLETCLQPTRRNEPKFIEPEDLEATKALPIIVGDRFQDTPGDTIVYQTTKTQRPTQQEKQSVEPPKEKAVKKEPVVKKKSRLPKALFFTSLFIVAAIAAGFILFLTFFMPDDIPVPNVVGMELAEATTTLEEEGLRVGEVREIYHEEVPAGAVIRTDPRADFNVKEGASINLVISLGSDKVEMNNYVGKMYEDVSSELAERFANVEIREEASTGPAGEILRQTPEAGTTINPAETDVILVVSSEHPAQERTITVRVPFTNIESDEAQQVEFFIEDANHTMDEPARTVEITADRDFEITFHIPFEGEAKYKVVRDGMTIIEQTLRYQSE